MATSYERQRCIVGGGSISAGSLARAARGGGVIQSARSGRPGGGALGSWIPSSCSSVDTIDDGGRD